MNEEQLNQLKNVLLSFASTLYSKTKITKELEGLLHPKRHLIALISLLNTAADELYTALERVDFSENHRLRLDGKYDVDLTYSDGIETEKKICMYQEKETKNWSGMEQKTYKTDCNHFINFLHFYNDYNFCPFCGGEIEITADDSNSR